MVSQSRQAKSRRGATQFGHVLLQWRRCGKDWVEAYQWLLLAARQGDEDAKKNITELERKLTPEQIAEGQKRARDFKPR